MAFAPTIEEFEAYNVSKINQLIDLPYPIPSRNPFPNASTLTNKVHNIWSYSRFSQKILYSRLRHDISEHIFSIDYQHATCNTTVPPLALETYKRMLPALRLASILLERSWYFLWHTRNGDVKEMDLATHGRARMRRYLEQEKPFTVEKKAQIEFQLDDMVSRMFYLCEMKSKSADCIAATYWTRSRLTRARGRPCADCERKLTSSDHPVFASEIDPLPFVKPLCANVWHGELSSSSSTSPTSPKPASKKPRKPLPPVNHIMCLGEEILTLLSPKYPITNTSTGAANPSTIDLWPLLDIQAQQRILLSLAVTFMHELVHTVWTERCDKRREKSGGHEPYFDPVADKQNELGFAWERWMFGGVLFQPEGEFDSGDRQHAFVRLTDPPQALNPPPQVKPLTRSQTRTQTPRDDPQTRILISLPSYPLLWQPTKHTSAPPYRPGSDPCTVSWLSTTSIANFFSKPYMQPWLDDSHALERARMGYQPKPNQRAFMPQVGFTPLATRTMYPYWYGKGREFRSSYYREVPWRAYELFLRRVVRAGRRAFEDGDEVEKLDASTVMASWGFGWGSVYRDSRDTSPAKAGARCGSTTSPTSHTGSGSGGIRRPPTPTPSETNTSWWAAKRLRSEQEHGGDIPYEDEYGLSSASGSMSVKAGRELGAPTSPDLPSNVHSPQRSPADDVSKATTTKKNAGKSRAPEARRQTRTKLEQDRSTPRAERSPKSGKRMKRALGGGARDVKQEEDEDEPEPKRRKAMLLDSYGHGFVLSRPPARGGRKV